jgi:hypothetical protein
MTLCYAAYSLLGRTGFEDFVDFGCPIAIFSSIEAVSFWLIIIPTALSFADDVKAALR